MQGPLYPISRRPRPGRRYHRFSSRSVKRAAMSASSAASYRCAQVVVGRKKRDVLRVASIFIKMHLRFRYRPLRKGSGPDSRTKLLVAIRYTTWGVRTQLAHRVSRNRKHDLLGFLVGRNLSQEARWITIRSLFCSLINQLPTLHIVRFAAAHQTPVRPAIGPPHPSAHEICGLLENFADLNCRSCTCQNR